mgnify:CR=1 FL=1
MKDARCLVVVGAQWGDEGKGKIVDVLSAEVGIIARYQGGANAGHTVHVGGDEFILHQIPSGILHQGTRCLLGNGSQSGTKASRLPKLWRSTRIAPALPAVHPPAPPTPPALPALPPLPCLQ